MLHGFGPIDALLHPARAARLVETSRRDPVALSFEEVLAELETPAPVREGNVDRASRPDRLPLEGVKILDFMWALAGPMATRILADYGATVVRIESTSRLDVCRTMHPTIEGEGPERAALFHSANAGKRMLTLDLRIHFSMNQEKKKPRPWYRLKKKLRLR